MSDTSDKDDVETATASRPDDVVLPKATITKLIAEYLPEGVQCSREARDLLTDALTEFVHLLTSETQQVCTKSGKQVLGPQHVIQALDQLGMADFKQDLEDLLTDHRRDAKLKVDKRRGGTASGIADKMGGITEQELAQKQAEMFEQARAKYESRQLAAQQESAVVATTSTTNTTTTTTEQNKED